jgi:hypothetical protein
VIREGPLGVLGRVKTEKAKQRLEGSFLRWDNCRRKCSVSCSRPYFREIHSSDRSARCVFTQPGSRPAVAFANFRLLLFDPEAVAQGHTCIVQEASLASLYPKAQIEAAKHTKSSARSMFWSGLVLAVAAVGSFILALLTYWREAGGGPPPMLN